jgi:hypothetical protein
MGLRNRLTVLAWAALVGTSGCSGCKGKPPPEKKVAPPPADRLGPGELPLGADKAFALPLPNGSRVMSRYGGTILVRCSYTADQLATYVRLHVTGGTVTAGAAQTRFDNVTVPAEPTRRLRIEVRTHVADGMPSEMVIHDVTPQPNDPSLSEEEKWRRAGLTPQGRPLDPKNMQ